MKIRACLLSIVAILQMSVYSQSGAKEDLVKYVNPLIGTAKTTTVGGLRFGSGTENNAQVQPSVTVPFGMTNWTPQTHNSEKKCLSSYYYKDSLITGFRGSHWLSGSCTQEYGSMSVMPVFGKFNPATKGRGSSFRHDKEVSTPYYYKVYLDDYDITAEMTATERCGIMKFTFSKSGRAYILIAPNNDKGEGYVKILPDKNEIEGCNPVRRIYQGWGKPAGFSGNFVMKFAKQVNGYGVFSDSSMFEKQASIQNKPNIGAYISFNVKKGETIIIKVGTSFVSTDQARKNLAAEIPGYDFNKIKNQLKKTWNTLLSKIKVEGGNNDDNVKFYTAMYHSFQQPRIYNDVDGSYPRFNGNARTDTIKKGNYYCDFSAWDTYRTLHSVYNMLIPDKQADMIRSLLTMGKVGGWLPIFPKWNSYTSAMIGDHVIALAAESYLKGVINLTEEDYALLKHNATTLPATYQEYADGKGRRALTSYLEYGYIPLEDSVKEAFHQEEQVSRTMEYAYDDYAMAQIAKKAGKMQDYEYFLNRSQNYRNVFDTSVNNVNGRYKDGTFYKKFNKKDYAPFITEGTAWQYTWYVPQDVPGLIKLMGGNDKFNKNLDDFFAANQYWHGNEPGQQIPFLYNYSGQPYKTQKVVSAILQDEYGTGPGGLSGNDDAGQISAWYIMGSLGFYPVCPASAEYQICGPKFKKITVTLGNKKKLVINAPEYTKDNIFIKRVMLNNSKLDSLTITHDALMKGGKMDYEMTGKPVE